MKTVEQYKQELRRLIPKHLINIYDKGTRTGAIKSREHWYESNYWKAVSELYNELNT